MSEPDPKPSSEVGGRYASYVLFVLVLVYIFNFIDRQILSILAEDIKADIGLSDAEIGFLYGTAFAVFYAVFGIPLGRLADVWTRKSLISAGLGFWSLMTALSGTARSFAALATFRIGVGVGEASATPAAFSMLSDYYPPRLRATVLAIYSSGVYIGAGIGIFLGGVILDAWSSAFPDPAEAPFGLRGWQAAFMVVGIPGLFMALWVRTLREPVRGQSEGLVTPPHPSPFREAGIELINVLPPFTLIGLVRLGASSRLISINLGFAALTALVAYGLIELLGSPAQWIALGIGVYATFSWAQTLKLRDPPTFAMIFGCKAMRYLTLGFPCIAFVGYGLGFWAAPFFIRVHGVSVAEVGTVLGLSAAFGGWMGVTLGGVLGDRFKDRTPLARIYVGLAVPILSMPFGAVILLAENIYVAYVANFFFGIVSAMWIGPAASTVNDLVMPRMRAIASAYYILMITFIGLALGPYAIGQLSDALNVGGMESGEALRMAMLSSLVLFVGAIVFLLFVLRHLVPEEASRLERARAAGEEIA
jgi:MFS family permease